jgi:hypothetical protein
MIGVPGLLPGHTVKSVLCDPRLRARRVTADVTKDSVRISIRDSSGVKDTAFATGGVITVPHVSMMYSVIELEIAAAIARGTAAHMSAGDSVPFRQWYPDRHARSRCGELFKLLRVVCGCRAIARRASGEHRSVQSAIAVRLLGH